ncbi:helix-turn-helix domain-containing protein [Cytobacillus oceanisediminis]|uniref:helix-turn-helix domain-containing protein n=1 Tax=Cytobacillus oceanisediminis TaxID=665099 RepID=UPI003735F7BC
MKGVGKKIRELRMKNGDTLEQLGTKLNFNYSNLSKIEREIRMPSVELIKEIAEIYDVQLSYFFGKEQEIPEELKKAGVEWITFIEDMEEQEISPEDIRTILEIVHKYNPKKKS